MLYFICVFVLMLCFVLVVPVFLECTVKLLLVGWLLNVPATC